jgi:hypothetical protein
MLKIFWIYIYRRYIGKPQASFLSIYYLKYKRKITFCPLTIELAS